MTSLPGLFLPHGAPDLVLSDHPAKHFLAGLPGMLPKPRAILIVSAHWETAEPTVTTVSTPITVHDFSGWPRDLYGLRYPARTDLRLGAAGIDSAPSARRGLDHGAWAPLMIAFPTAEIPVVQLSLKRGAQAAEHFGIGSALAPLRTQGVLIVGSGSVTHNLRALAPDGTRPPDWAAAFDRWVEHALEQRSLRQLLGFPIEPAEARLAHPSIEHFLPFFVAMGAGWQGGRTRLPHRSFTYGLISMTAEATWCAAGIGRHQRNPGRVVGRRRWASADRVGG